MKDIPLECTNMGHPWAPWTLRLSDDGMLTLTAANGLSFGPLDRAAAVASFRLPSFWGNVKYLQIAVASQLLEFQCPNGGLADIREFLEGSVVAVGGLDAVEEIRRAGKNVAWQGGGLMALGIAASVLGYYGARANGGQYYLFFGFVIFGLSRFALGVQDMLRAGRMRSSADAPGFPVTMPPRDKP